MRPSFEALLDNAEIRGSVEIRVATGVPPVTDADMRINLRHAYADGSDLERGLIRRLAHCEVFAKALEQELEKLRGVRSP